MKERSWLETMVAFLYGNVGNDVTVFHLFSFWDVMFAYALDSFFLPLLDLRLPGGLLTRELCRLLPLCHWILLPPLAS